MKNKPLVAFGAYLKWPVGMLAALLAYTSLDGPIIFESFICQVPCDGIEHVSAKVHNAIVVDQENLIAIIRVLVKMQGSFDEVAKLFDEPSGEGPYLIRSATSPTSKKTLGSLANLTLSAAK